MKLIHILLVTLCVIIATSVWAEDCKFDIRIENSTDVMVIYHVKWWTHPFKAWGPIVMSGGELNSGKTYTRKDCACGIWSVELSGESVDYTHAFDHQNQETRIIKVPHGNTK